MENDKVQARQMNPLALAFLGDAVYDLLARDMLVRGGGISVSAMHKKKVELVRAAAQSEAVGKILPHLTEEEQTILRRGRNANAGHSPKNADVLDYRRATGLEALFGYLYLCGELPRIREIFARILSQPVDGSTATL